MKENMKNIFKQLYNGEISPQEQMKPILDEYKEKIKKLAIKECLMLEKLDFKMQDELDEFISEFYNLMPDEISEVFAEGFSYGARFMIEVLYIHQ